MMQRHLANTDIEVQYLFSGRDKEHFFDMEEFGDFLWRRGLTFATKEGKVQYINTVLQSHPIQFVRDVLRLNVKDYDVIISDYEPITAWAGRLANKPVIGLGHQYAFTYPKVPKKGGDFIGNIVMKSFAPVKLGIGLHWHHFDSAIIPPMVPPELRSTETPGNHFLVYLPFEDQQQVTDCLNAIPEVPFIQYSGELSDGESDNVQLRKASQAGFKRDLANAKGVISNAGFMLLSECLHIGKPVLCKPVENQAEQFHNIMALEKLGFGTALYSLEPSVISHWINEHPAQIACNYPDVAKYVVNWLQGDNITCSQALVDAVWDKSSWQNAGLAC
jgi:uncharacterized protein (TIGR00661 family)